MALALASFVLQPSPGAGGDGDGDGDRDEASALRLSMTEPRTPMNFRRASAATENRMMRRDVIIWWIGIGLLCCGVGLMMLSVVGLM